MSKAVYTCQDWEIDLSNRELRRDGAPVPLGSRAIEIVGILAEAAGGTISKYDLLDRVWPGAIVTENTLQFHISAVRKALGRDRGMLKTIFGRGYRLLGEWMTREDDPRAGAYTDEMPHANGHPLVNNLPAPVSALIGRSAAIRDLQDCLSAYRVVTLTGVGGVGKTSLAVEVARRTSATSQDAVVLVELASVADPDLVPTAVARSLGQRLSGDQVTSHAVAQAIGRRKLLLVLDNCEHLVAAAAELAEKLVHACPETTILATSREPLRIEGEHVYRLPPLGVPDHDSNDPFQHGSVQLFAARAGDHASFSVRDDDLSAIVTICQRLDGIPLAIEFAAARAATLGIQHVATHLHNRFELLGGTRRTALPRHRTLRATLDWSYELLTEPEQRLLRSFAVFPGGLSLEAAAAMARANKIPDVEETISNLVWKSFLALVQSKDGMRWRLLETIRAYALEKLAESGEARRAARLHAEFFRYLLSPTEDSPLVTLNDLPRYLCEIDNVRAALDWSFSDEGDKAVGVALAATFAPVWLDLTLFAECRRRVEQAQEYLPSVSNVSEALEAQLLTTLGLVHSYAGAANDKTWAALTDALDISERRHDPEAQMQALYAGWTHKFFAGDLHASYSLAERMALIARETGDPADAQVADRLLGSTNHFRGNQRQAQRHFEDAFNHETDTRGRQRLMWFHHGGQVLPRARMARTLWMRGLANKAIDLAKACLEEARTIDSKQAMSAALTEALCPIHLMAGDIAMATQYVTMLSKLAHGSMFARYARSFQGVLSIKCGDSMRGLEMLRSSLDEFGTAEPLSDAEFITHFATPHGSAFAIDYAAALISLGDLVGAETAIDNAMAGAKAQGILWHLPELMRMKGELVIRPFDDRSCSAAERIFSEAFALAEEQGAVFWQLRIALSIARSRPSEDRSRGAHAMLVSICDRFADEVEFSDLRLAREFLSSLAR